MAERAAEGVPLGDLIVNRGLAARAVVDAAVEKQRREARSGVFRRLGEILVEDGALKPHQLRDLLSLQGKTILVCPVCIAQYNVDGYQPGRVALCERCSVVLTVPERLDRIVVEDELPARTSSGRLVLAAVSRDATERGPLAGLGTMRKFGPYEIHGEISRGGMGIVYKARQPGLDRLIALKVILAGQASAEDVERFHREARAVARLRHPNIVAIHEVGEIDGVNFFSMDFIEGLTVDRAVVQEGLGPRDIAAIFVKICDAIGYAHKQRIVHRDLKPRNIIIDKRHEPIVIDFGIARLHELEGEAGALTKSGEILGSPAYLAPEYLAGTVVDYDEMCDVWSLGACLYHALAGRSPHAADDTIKIIRKASTTDAPHIRSIQRNVDRDMATIVMTAVERERANRYHTAEEMAHDLRRYLDGEEISARSSALVRWWRRVRTKVAVALGLLLSFALVGMSGYYAERLREIQAAHQVGAVTAFEHEALRERFVDRTLELGETLLAANRALDAERAASEALAEARGTRRADLYRLRARARRALGKTSEAEADERLAGGK
jgi:serine/threonine protein kinase